MHVSRRKSKLTEYQTSIKKFLDRSKESIKRLKALRHGLEKSSTKEVKEFFTEHSTDVFYVVYGSFTTLELSIQDKLSKGRGYGDLLLRDLCDIVLPQFRLVLTFLPELIHQKWQFNSICLVIRKLLHPENHMNLRRYGVQLLVLWLEALQENAGDASMELFASVIPHFPPQKTPMGLPLPTHPTSSSNGSSSLSDRYGLFASPTSARSFGSWTGTKSQGHLNRSSSAILLGPSATPSSREVVIPNRLIPLMPCPPGQSDLFVTEELMKCLLDSLTDQTHCLHWNDPKQSLRGFAHLFFLFKLFYVVCLYKDFQKEACLYTPPSPPVIDLSSAVEATHSSTHSPPDGLHSLIEEPSQEETIQTPPLVVGGTSPQYKRKRTSPYRLSTVIKLEYDLSNPVYMKVKNILLTYILRWFLPSTSYQGNRVELMKEMWFATRDNISLLLEVCRQGFLTLTEPAYMKSLIELYRYWIQVPEKFPFMKHPPSVVHEPAVSPAVDSKDSSGGLVLSWEQLSNYEGFQAVDVAVGMPASLCMIIAHTQQVFIIKEGGDLALQMELCRKVIRLYQDIVVSWFLDKASWEYLLAVLLHHTWRLLTHKDTRLGCALANSILKTLLVCFLRACVTIKLSPHLWDSLLLVLHSLTHWKEVIIQWKSTMASITEVLALAVYGINLSDLPLDQLALGHKRGRAASMGRSRTSPSQQEIAPPRLSSFSAILVGPPGQSRKVRLTTPSIKSVHKDQPSESAREASRKHVKRLPFTRSVTQEERSSPPVTVLSTVKRHSTPNSRPLLQSSFELPDTISEVSVSSTTSDRLSRKQEVQTNPPTLEVQSNSLPNPTQGVSLSKPAHPTEEYQSNSLSDPTQRVSPSQPLLQEEIEEEDEVSSGDIEGSSSVIANLNTKSPSPKTTPTHSQEDVRKPPLGASETSPPWHQEKGKNGDGKRNLLYSTIFKHRSPESRPKKKLESGDLVLTNQNLLGHSPPLADGLKSRLKRKWFHKRSESDVPTSGQYLEMGMEHENDPKSSCPSAEEKKVFLIRKSSSDSNIHRLAVNQYDDTLPETVLSNFRYEDDSALQQHHGFRRVSTIASPVMTEFSDPGQSSVDDSVVATTGTSSSVHQRPLRRSLTIDSPEPPLKECDEREYPSSRHGHTSPVPPPSSPTGGPYLGGWSPEVAAIVWLRMLKILGNVNCIQDPSIYAEAMGGLQDIWNALYAIRANSGISLTTPVTPPLPEYMPCLDLLLPWVIQACSLPAAYSKGREIAYRLLCEMTILHWHTPPSLQHLAHFYHLLHLALQPSSDVSAVAVKHCSQLFSHGLAGSSVLLLDCVVACDALLASPSSTSPRNEALYLLGSLLYLPELQSPLPVPCLSMPEGGGTRIEGEELKEQVVAILLRSAISEGTRIARCIALYLVGSLTFSGLYANKPSRRLPDGVDILLASLQFADRGVAMCAIDMMSLLTQVATQMLQLYPSISCRILQAICYAIAVFLTEELDHASWVDKVVVTLLLLLRDWLIALPLQSLVHDSPEVASTIKTVFEVLQAAAGSQQHISAKRHALSQLFTIRSPVNVDLHQLETSNSRSPQNRASQSQSHFRSSRRRRGNVQLSSDRLKSTSHQLEDGKIQTAARSVLTHLLNLLGHFPFGCGAAQLNSNIKEYHDCPSLLHLEDLTPEVFDSPRIQFFALNSSAVVTLVEIPTLKDGVPGEVSAGPYQTRVIVRDVTGKYTWDSTLLYGLDTVLDDSCSLVSAESMDSLVESVGAVSEPLVMPNYVSSHGDPLQAPSWRTHANNDRDVLQDLLEHVEQTSPECVLDLWAIQDQMVPYHSIREGGRGEGEEATKVESTLLSLLRQQQTSEGTYLQEALSQHGRMRGEKASAPMHFKHTIAFHHCRVFLSHLGLLSWEKRNHLNLLDKTNQLILELKNLDLHIAQSRATYKVAVLYIRPGQEDKVSILNNRGGSQSYEDFVAGLGWEVNMETHAGYMAGMQKEFASCSMPYYATSSEEVLFHVATRMSSRRLEQKVRHLGNDEVHIVWSEHWRDYRRSIFKTQFADVLIILYPLHNGLIRIHINKKSNVPQFGPLFDGAVVDRKNVAPLVRATAINALRAQRNPLIGYRARYEERLKYIQTITSNQLLSTFEEFCENVMHPLEMSSSQPAANASRTSPLKVVGDSTVSITNLLRSSAQQQSSVSLPARNQTTPSTSYSLLTLPPVAVDQSLPRQRANTNDERLLVSFHQAGQSQILNRNSSVPENLNDLNVYGGALSSPDLFPGQRKPVYSISPIQTGPSNTDK